MIENIIDIREGEKTSNKNVFLQCCTRS